MCNILESKRAFDITSSNGNLLTNVAIQNGFLKLVYLIYLIILTLYSEMLNKILLAIEVTHLETMSSPYSIKYYRINAIYTFDVVLNIVTEFMSIVKRWGLAWNQLD